jgi:hypothetical protein
MACHEWNGVEWSGVGAAMACREWNGMEWSASGNGLPGMQWNGVEWERQPPWLTAVVAGRQSLTATVADSRRGWPAVTDSHCG